MAANDLSSNPLYDTEDNDDGDRRLATSSFMPRTRREPDGFGVEAGKKKQAKANTKSFSGTAGIKLATSKMFGTFDVSDFIAEDEMTINASKRDDTYTGSIHEREFVLDDQIEKKKKEITWNSSPVVGQRVTQEKRSIEKHEEQMTRQGESRFLNGILNQTIVFDQRDDIEIVVTNENKPSGLPQTQVNQIQSSLTSGFGITQSLVQPQTSMNESMIKQKSALGFSFTPTLGSQFSQSLYPLKRSSLNNDLPIRDRNDLKKILTKSMYDRRKQVTNEEIMRSMKETDFTKADELQPDEHSKEQQNGRPMDEEKRPGKLDISEIAALEEGDADYDPEGSEQEFEEGYDEVKKEIERMENLMMSDDEDQILKSRIGDESNPQSAHEKRENSNMNQNKRTDASDSDEDDSNFLDDEADEGEEGDEEEIEEDEGTSQVGVDNQLEAEEVIDDESNPAEQKIMRRLKKAKDVKAAKKAEKRKRRAERHAKFIENEKKRKEFLRTTDLIEHEADLGEVIDGKDAGMKRINVGLCVILERR